MTRSNQPPEPDRNDLAQRVRDIDWRVRRLEASQMPASAISENFQQIYDELDELHDKSDLLDAKLTRVEEKIDTGIVRLEGKIDTILQHLTGYQGQ